MGKILYLPNTHHVLIPGLPRALETQYEVRPIRHSIFNSLLGKFRNTIGFMGIRFRRRPYE